VKTTISGRRRALAKRCVIAGRISISQSEWTSLNLQYSEHELGQAISDAVDIYDIPPPYKRLSLADACSSFYELRHLKTGKLWKAGKWFDRFGPYKYPPTDRYIDIDNKGLFTSDFFHEKERWRVRTSKVAPVETWKSSRFRYAMLRALFTLKVKEVNETTLRSAIALRTAIASQFRPSAAKAIFDLFEAQDVLDFSMGWGDRLAAFEASSNARSYFGIDPNIRLHKGYAAQHACYATGKQVHFLARPAEEVTFKSGDRFDLAFSSPPYFCKELYQDQGGTQSHLRYKTAQAWLERFLFVVLKRAYKALRPDGFLVINLADIHHEGEVVKLCDPMCDYLTSLGASYCGSLGLRLVKRPKSASDRSGVFAEPLWCWRRGEKIDLSARPIEIGNQTPPSL
jgi:hypothetical protein